jgi:hypothetical protein
MNARYRYGCIEVEEQVVEIQAPFGARRVLCFAFYGTIPSGSEGNPAMEKLRTLINSRTGSSDCFLVLDFAECKYVCGDAVGGLWLSPMARGATCVIVASGESRSALERLCSSSIAVPIAGSRREALDLIASIGNE